MLESRDKAGVSGENGIRTLAVMELFRCCLFCWSFVPGGGRCSTFVPEKDSMQNEYDDPNISEFLTVFAKWCCPWNKEQEDAQARRGGL